MSLSEINLSGYIFYHGIEFDNLICVMNFVGTVSDLVLLRWPLTSSTKNYSIVRCRVKSFAM
jgi:hypothetical protein